MTNIYKQSAKTILNGYWLRSITVVMFTLGVSYFPAIIMQIVLALTETPVQSTIGTAFLLFDSAVGTLLAAPVSLGFNRILWLRTDGQAPSLSEVLYLYGNPRLLLKYLGLYILKTLIVAVPAGVVASPALIITVALEGYLDSANELMVAVISLGMLALFFIATLLLVLQSVRYSLLDFVFIKHSDKSVGFILSACSKLCLKRFKLIVSIYFSFIGWILLNATGFGQLYTTPYLSAALASAARQFNVQDEYNDGLAEKTEVAPV